MKRKVTAQETACARLIGEVAVGVEVQVPHAAREVACLPQHDPTDEEEDANGADDGHDLRLSGEVAVEQLLAGLGRVDEGDEQHGVREVVAMSIGDVSDG